MPKGLRSIAVYRKTIEIDQLGTVLLFSPAVLISPLTMMMKSFCILLSMTQLEVLSEDDLGISRWGPVGTSLFARQCGEKKLLTTLL